MPQLVAGIAQQVLHIALFRLIAGEGQVQPLQMAGSEPVFDFLLEEIVDRPLPLAEQQPVARTRLRGALTQVSTKSGQAGAIADQDHRRAVCRSVKGRIGANTQRHVAPERCVLAQPAGTEPDATVGVMGLADEQLQCAVGRHRGDRVLAVRQQRQGQQSADVLSGEAGFLLADAAFGECMGQRLLALHRLTRVVPEATQQGFDFAKRMLRADFGDVTGAPERSLGPAQTKLEDRRARTPRVQAGAGIQAPALVRRRLPVGKVATAADMAQLMLPVAQHAGIAAIRAEQIEQRQGA